MNDSCVDFWGDFRLEPTGEVTYLDVTGGETMVAHAVAVDAGDNELGRVPARDWQTLTTKHAKAIREGRVHVVGV